MAIPGHNSIDEILHYSFFKSSDVNGRSLLEEDTTKQFDDLSTYVLDQIKRSIGTSKIRKILLKSIFLHTLLHPEIVEIVRSNVSRSAQQIAKLVVDLKLCNRKI